ncbi:lecithin retinol acyltransferase family protein [Vibrio fortis]|uniref:lecithin retinol acyltransferase family protein n=1 Tax=Vibrio fortis TaxID=212667 RepID=UPI002F3E5B3B
MNEGDHLVTPRLGYTHHGLYIGDGMVIHYSGFSEFLDKGSIEITTLSEFSQGHNVSIKTHLVPVYTAEERVQRAYEKLGEDSYNLVFNNCEHFVNWCFNGFKSSSQVNNVVSVAGAAGHEYMKRKAVETTVSVVAQQATRMTATKTAEVALTSAVAKTAVSTTAGTVAGVTAASTVGGSAATGVVAAVATGSLASAAAPVAIAVGVGYGVKKVFDWLWD